MLLLSNLQHFIGRAHFVIHPPEGEKKGLLALSIVSRVSCQGVISLRSEMETNKYLDGDNKIGGIM